MNWLFIYEKYDEALHVNAIIFHNVFKPHLIYLDFNFPFVGLPFSPTPNNLWAVEGQSFCQIRHYTPGKEGKKGLMTFTSPSTTPPTARKRKMSQQWPENLLPPHVGREEVSGFTTTMRNAKKLNMMKIPTLIRLQKHFHKPFWVYAGGSSSNWTNTICFQRNVIFRNATKIFEAVMDFLLRLNTNWPSYDS